MTAAAIGHRDVNPSNIPGPGPIVKWAGGKAGLLPELLRRLPSIGPGARYFEPFAGGAALFFALAPRLGDGHAILGDANADLIALYRAVAEDVEDLIALLEHLTVEHNEATYYRLRDEWNAHAGDPDDHAARAAAMLYLNRACFNGLWRVNRTGALNSPFGDGRPVRFDLDNLRAAAVVLARAELRHGEYWHTLRDARAGDLVYLDSPYDGTWTGYTADAFGDVAQRELADEAHRLADRGIHVMLSNADTPLIRELYAWARIDTVRAPRAINSDADGRGEVDELLVLAGPDRSSRTTPTPPRPERTRTTMDQTSLHTTEDVIERGLRNVLPVKLTDPEILQISKRRVVVEAEIDDMANDLKRETERRKELIQTRQDDVAKMRRWIRDEAQERVVDCTKVFRRELDGSGWVVTIRNDTFEEVTREPATPRQMQRYLPGVDPAPPPTNGAKRSVLDEATAAQLAEDRSKDDDGDDMPPAGEGEEDLEAEPGYAGDDGHDSDDLGIEVETVDVGPQDIGELPTKPRGKNRGSKPASKPKRKGRG